MAVQPNDVVAQMRATLALTDPDLDTTVGTTTRKILDTVGEVVSEGYVDRYTLSYNYDIDNKSGSDLDDFVAIFGFTRLIAKRATGSVTFERSSSSDTTTVISVATQLSTDDATPVLVQTLVPGVMMRTDTSITIPCAAVLGGASGNIGASAIARATVPLSNVGSVTNLVSFTGGTEAESDDQLRERFKRTVFRSMAGTEQQFLGTALEDPDVSLVNVIGATKTHREQIEIIGGTATSTLTGYRYVYPNSAYFGTSLDDGDVYVPGVQFSFNTSTLVVTIISGALPDGIYELSFDYVPAASRNDPVGGVTNRVDVYVNGIRPIEAIEIAIFRTATVFTSGTSDPLYTQNFSRPDGTHPTAGNYFIDLAFSPLLDATTIGDIDDDEGGGGASDGQLVIGGITYTQGTHYFIVNDTSRDGGTVSSQAGFEFKSTANGNPLAIPANNAQFTADYVYNEVPGDVEDQIAAWKLVTTDAKVHAAKQMRLRLNLIVILNSGVVRSSVQTAAEAAVTAYMNSVGFDGVVQVSDLLDAVANVSGIDAVRFKTSADDSVSYAIQQMSDTGTVLKTYATTDTVKRAIDVFMTDDTVPVFNDVLMTVKALNSFGAV